MTVTDVLIALGALSVLAAVGVTASRPGSPVPIAWDAIAELFAGIAALLALWRLLDPAPSAPVDRAIGAWLGAAAAAVMAVSLWRGMADQGPERRNPEAERAATAAARERAELLSLPPDAGQTS